VAAEAGGRARLDEDLVEEVNFMVEYPTALVGHFDSRYLELPDDVIVTVMSGHQRYFAVQNPDGTLLPLFVAIRNGDEQGLDTVRTGNERVIEPRLADAEFYLTEDMRMPLSDRLEDLQARHLHRGPRQPPRQDRAPRGPRAVALHAT
jgi:glycyl-tRNA synthetase beta chain